MNRLRATNSVPFASRDIAPVTGTPQYATNGNPVGPIPGTIWPGYMCNMIIDEIMTVVLAAGLTPDDTNWGQLLQAIQALTGHGRLLNIQVFATAGTFTYTPTAGTNSIDTEVQGAGGAGGGAPATGAGQNSLGGGGGSGAYSRKRLTSGFSGATITVGAAGAGVAGGTGGSGGSSSFGGIVSCGGGNGGLTVGPTSSTSYVVPTPASIAIPTFGDVNVPGALPGPTANVSGNSVGQAIAAGMFGPAYGSAGYSALPNVASQPAVAGGNGRGGIVIVREYS